MSWSRSVSGTAAAVIAALDAIPAEVEQSDRSSQQPDRVVELHQGQVARASDAVRAFAEDAPEGYQISGSLSGHAGVNAEDGSVQSDQVSVSLSAYKPAAAAS